MSGGPSPRVLILVLDPKSHKRNYKRVAGLTSYFLDEEGAQVDVLTAEPRGWGRLDERARLHHLHAAEARHPLPWLERMVVTRLPRFAVRPLKRLGRPGDVLGRVQGRLSSAVHRRLFLPFYRHVRPLLLARIARRRIRREIDMGEVRRIIVMDVVSVPCAWRLARKNPDLTVTTRQVRTLDPDGG
ncbi:hypothetical protein E1293_32040 [Actinomadura darangshiensis]|uniref:Glycosyltransferase family 1 protein n=1 Tax=Actinomadura darangshiensis TaxID=705336 RepID=A0A4R5ANA0_9ACTN|nr:hypothetical protein [Actinomadura darangshiensis]TDD73210.1 hypothetical protein E1293_32040 [Actinomadura darangshiensis]